MKNENLNKVIRLLTKDTDNSSENIFSKKPHSILKSDSFSLIKIEIPKGEEIPNHKAPSSVIIQCISGCITFTFSEREEVMNAGDLIVLEAAVEHALYAQEDSIILLTLIKD